MVIFISGGIIENTIFKKPKPSEISIKPFFFLLFFPKFRHLFEFSLTFIQYLKMYQYGVHYINRTGVKVIRLDHSAVFPDMFVFCFALSCLLSEGATLTSLKSNSAASSDVYTPRFPEKI